ncbi:DsrE family protein [Yeosuana sp. MJ-SS3]|uniref:DsrE family protein n=1 Tax=Gilvirhabdus luticola TaxID=3079858 RepID=A0ABU3U6B8_9FLAO|nr:DsrE family protein [Yeosuana sp. MJ-SS3]MDU8885949.1 DsrE family protein [Yeosuana sp. MJ-SS3]
MKIILFLCFTASTFFYTYAQDSLPQHLKGKIKYPVIDVHPMVGVLDIDSNALHYDASIDYKIVIDAYDKMKDSTQVYKPLSEVARIYNLNIANGVPEDKLQLAMVYHSFNMDPLLNDESYQAKYGIDNPNTELISTLKDLGVHFYVCGQLLGFFNVPSENLASQIEIAVSAKTALITLDQMGYSYLNVNED